MPDRSTPIDHSTSPLRRGSRVIPWAAPLAVTGLVLGGVALSTAASSGAVPNLPARTAKQLLVSVQESSTTALSGVVHESAALGLPDLPATGQQNASLTWQSFVTGSHNAKVWIDGPQRQRAALLGELSEAEVVHNGRDVWTYTSGTNTVTHTVLPEHQYAAGRHPMGADAPRTDYTPAAAADAALKAIKPSTEVRVETARRVARRDAYMLVLQPRDARSTVRRVTIAIDSKTSVPLQVQVFGSGSTPALSVGFSSVSFTRPAASVFRYTVPKGATVATNPLTDDGRHHWDGHARPGRGSKTVVTYGRHPAYSSTLKITKDKSRPTVIGSGWTSVVRLPAGSMSGAVGGDLLDKATTALSNGSRLLHTALLNAVIRADGTVFVGAVQPAALENIASSAK